MAWYPENVKIANVNGWVAANSNITISWEKPTNFNPTHYNITVIISPTWVWDTGNVVFTESNITALSITRPIGALTQGYCLTALVTALPAQPPNDTTGGSGGPLNPIRINYTPAAPGAFSTVAETQVSPSSSISFASAATPDSGGRASGFTTTNYRLNFSTISTDWTPSTATGGTSISLPISTNIFTAFAGQTISTTAQAFDGWVTSDTNTARNFRIGNTLTSSSGGALLAPSLSSAYLNSTTSLTYQKTYIDSYSPVVSQTVIAQYQVGSTSGTWKNLRTEIYPSTLGSSATIANVMQLLSNLEPSIFTSALATIYFRFNITIGHLSAISPTTSIIWNGVNIDVSIVGTNTTGPPSPNASGDYVLANNVSTILFPMDSTIPLSFTAVYLGYNIKQWASGTGTLTLRGRKVGVTSWTTLFSRSITTTDTKGYYTYSPLTDSVSLLPGETIEFSWTVTATSGGSTTTIGEGNINWPSGGVFIGQDGTGQSPNKNRFMLRNAPNITLSQQTNQLNFIRRVGDPGVTTLQQGSRITTPFTLSWMGARSFGIIESYITINTAKITDALSVATNTSKRLPANGTNSASKSYLAPMIEVGGTATDANNTVSGSAPGVWVIKTVSGRAPIIFDSEITSASTNVTPTNASILNNAELNVVRTIKIREFFRSSTASGITENWNDNLNNYLTTWDIPVQTINTTYVANTFCPPTRGAADPQVIRNLWT